VQCDAAKYFLLVLILLGFLLQSLQEVNVVLKAKERKKLKKDFSTTVCHSKDKITAEKIKNQKNDEVMKLCLQHCF